jgi:hypothetical protein
MPIPEGMGFGFKVKVHGLTNRAELNGTEGVATSGIVKQDGTKVDGFVVTLADGTNMKMFRKNLHMALGATVEVKQTTSPVEKYVPGPTAPAASASIAAPAPASASALSSVPGPMPPNTPSPTSINWVPVPEGSQAGFRVRIHGLMNKAELNDKEGWTTQVLPSDIDGFVVRMDEGGAVMKMFRKNLQMDSSSVQDSPLPGTVPPSPQSGPAPATPQPSAAPASPIAAVAPAESPGPRVSSSGVSIFTEPIPTGFTTGFRTMVTGLVNKAELNGLVGTAIESLAPTDGYLVALDNGKTMKVFTKNLCMEDLTKKVSQTMRTHLAFLG